jgi:hypothetical protein
MRNRTSKTLSAAMVLLLVGPPGPFVHAAAGQTGRPERPRGGPRNPDGPPGVAPVEIQRMLDGYELMQAQEMLQLGDDQLPRFLPRLRALQEARRGAQMQRFRAIQDLRRMTRARSTQDEGAIRNAIRAFDELDVRSAAEVRQAREALDQVLDTFQQGRFRLFEEAMQQRKVELLMRARQANRQNRPTEPFAP